MLHMKFEISGCSGLREVIISMDLNARVGIIVDGKTDGPTDGRTENRMPISHLAKACATKNQNKSKKFLQEQKLHPKRETWAILRSFGYSSLISDPDMIW